jgi:hypothetical protein
MSWICQEYPRRILEFGQFTETTLELACPRVAQIFLENKEPLTMDVAKTPPRHVMWKMDNEDKGFLKQLEALRSQTMAEISACPHFDRVAMQQLYEHYDKLHHLVVRNKLQALEGEISALRLTGGDGTQFLFYPMEMMDKVIAYNLDESGLVFKLPELKKLIKGYYRYFNGFTGQQAADFYHTHRKRMQQALPETEEKYRAYYQYYLWEMLLTGYEDYHVLKVILLGHMYLQIYMVLDLVAWLDAEAKGEAYDISRQALVLSNLERRMRHNTGITDGILGRIRQDFL